MFEYVKIPVTLEIAKVFVDRRGATTAHPSRTDAAIAHIVQDINSRISMQDLPPSIVWDGVVPEELQ